MINVCSYKKVKYALISQYKFKHTIRRTISRGYADHQLGTFDHVDKEKPHLQSGLWRVLLLFHLGQCLGGNLSWCCGPAR